MGFVWAGVSGVLFALSHVSAKYLYDVYPFLTGFVWTRAMTGLVGLLVLLFPSVRKTFRKKYEKPKTNAKRHAGIIVVLTKIFGVIAVVLIQYASAIGSVSLVMAMSGLQYACMFVIILLCTKFIPRVFKEYITKRELVVEWLAIVLVGLGSILFVL